MASPELEKLVATLRASAIAGERPLHELRAGWEKFAESFPQARDIDFTPVDASGVYCEWVTPPTVALNRVVLFLHGGGYTIGSVGSYRNFTGNLARAADARLLSVEYRLAPEHPFPAAIEDAVSAFEWLLEQGTAPERIVVAGDSAGGGLALATALSLRDAGKPLPAAIVAICPSTDLAKEGASVRERQHLDPVVNFESSMAHALRYVGDESRLKDPLASPLYADLHGLPPVLMLVGTHEILYDDSTRFAQKAQEAGVHIDLDIWDEMIHVWPLFADVLPEGREAIAKIGSYIRDRMP